MNENRELKKQSRSNFGASGFGNQQEEQRLRSEVSRLQNENRELQQRAASAAPSGYPPASVQNGNTAFYEREIQKWKQEKKKVEDDKKRVEEEKRKLETELSSLRTGQYGKPMPNFSGDYQSTKNQEELENMKEINKLLSEENQNMSDRLQSLEAEKKRVEARLQSENEDLKREIANLRGNMN